MIFRSIFSSGRGQQGQIGPVEHAAEIERRDGLQFHLLAPRIRDDAAGKEDGHADLGFEQCGIKLGNTDRKRQRVSVHTRLTKVLAHMGHAVYACLVPAGGLTQSGLDTIQAVFRT